VRVLRGPIRDIESDTINFEEIAVLDARKFFAV
jgi:hypothetical protein